MLRAKNFLGAPYRQRLRLIDKFTAAIVTLARITLRILVGQHRTDGLQDRVAGVILGGDHLQSFFLPFAFALDNRGDFGIDHLNGS